MTRTDIINLVTSKLGITDATAKVQAGVFLDARWGTIWNEEDWRQARYQQSINVNVGDQDLTLDPNFEFVKACRWKNYIELLPTNDTVAMATNPSGYDTQGPVLAFIPLGKNTAGNVVIRLIQQAQQAGTLLVIGKAKCTTLGVNDTPLIPGADQVLCELVMGDLYEWLRQMTKAQYFFQKGAALLQKMKDIETAQSGDVMRIVPVEQTLDGEYTYDSLRPLG